MSQSLLEVKNLVKHFIRRSAIFGRETARVHAVDDERAHAHLALREPRREELRLLHGVTPGRGDQHEGRRRGCSTSSVRAD